LLFEYGTFFLDTDGTGSNGAGSEGNDAPGSVFHSSAAGDCAGAMYDVTDGGNSLRKQAAYAHVWNVKLFHQGTLYDNEDISAHQSVWEVDRSEQVYFEFCRVLQPS